MPVNPGRVLITPESGSPYYATLTRADNPTQEGTPLNKANLLKDTTAALLGGDSSMVPDEALVALFQKVSNSGGQFYICCKIYNYIVRFESEKSISELNRIWLSQAGDLKKLSISFNNAD